jgi:hypothetical protein
MADAILPDAAPDPKNTAASRQIKTPIAIRIIPIVLPIPDIVLLSSRI